VKAVTLRPPAHDASAGLTPAKQVTTGIADFGVGPSEAVVAVATADTDPSARLVAVATLCQAHMSSICCLASSGITRPRELEGKSYGSYVAKFENAIVRRMVIGDGGDADRVEFRTLVSSAEAESGESHAKGTVVETHLETGLADAAWIYTHWQGVMSSRSGRTLNHFSSTDYAIPHGYSPILHATRGTAESATARAFLKSTAEGYKIASADPAAAVAALRECGHPSLADVGFITASAESIKGCFLDDEGRWGRMDQGRWTDFVDFLAEVGTLLDGEGIEVARDKVKADKLFTNAALPE